MNVEQAPIEYIKQYYEQRVQRRRQFTDATEFYLSELKQVRGKRVLNVGCGPQLYDYLPYYGEVPELYYGLDINKHTFEYLEHSQNSELLIAKQYAQKNNIDVHYVSEDLAKSDMSIGQFDCIVGVGFFGTFGKSMFLDAIDSVNHKLSDSGIVVNISWYDCHLSGNTYQEKLKYRFDRVDGPTLNNAVNWTEQRGFRLIHRAIFDVPDKQAYGWGKIQSCVFEKIK